FFASNLWSGRSFDSRAEAQQAVREYFESLRGFDPKQWREVLESDPDSRQDILRTLANNKTTSDKDLNEVLDRVRGVPDASNIVWRVHKNPNASKATADRAKAMYDKGFEWLAGEETEPEKPKSSIRKTLEKK